MEEQTEENLISYKLQQIFGRLDKIDRKLDEGVNRTEFNAITKRVEDLEDTNKWLNRLVIGFVILFILGAIIVTKKA